MQRGVGGGEDVARDDEEREKPRRRTLASGPRARHGAWPNQATAITPIPAKDEHVLRLPSSSSCIISVTKRGPESFKDPARAGRALLTHLREKTEKIVQMHTST